MSNEFASRKPYKTTLIAVVLGPSIAAAYLNRGKLALYYFLIYIPVLLSSGLFMFPIIPFALAQGIGASHIYRISKRNPISMPKHWYSRWYVLTPFALATFLLFAVELIGFSMSCYFEDPTSDFYCGCINDPNCKD